MSLITLLTCCTECNQLSCDLGNESGQNETETLDLGAVLVPPANNNSNVSVITITI